MNILRTSLLALTVAALSLAGVVNSAQAGTPSGEDLYRISGADRYETAVAISKKQFSAGSAKRVYLYNADSPIDALAAVPLTQSDASFKGPLLPVKGGTYLPQSIVDEIDRVLKPAPDGILTFLGGPGAVAQQIEDDYTAAGFSTYRFNGVNRFDTAAKIGEAVRDNMAPKIPNLFIVNGYSSSDALVVGPLAGQLAKGMGGVILLSHTDGAPTETLGFMDAQSGTGVIKVIGGTSVITKDLAESLALRHWGSSFLYERFAGDNRYDTARVIAHQFLKTYNGIKDTHGVGVASGETLVDALPAGPLLASMFKPLLFVQEDSVTCPSADYLYDNKAEISTGYVFGGETVVSAQTKLDAEGLMSGTKTPAELGC